MPELLAPAGSMAALEAAVYAGADAVYVGGAHFNARAFATNFTLEELKTAVRFCHLHDVRLFVTVNTIYKEDEMAQLYDYLKALYDMQVDALIIQDEGLMDLVFRHFENFEVHASTQCSVHNLDGVRHYEKMGVKRVVLARENSLEEIRHIIDHTTCEIEVFVHGALCVAYSGQCYLSQSIGKRSANRGQCAQPCRLPYTLVKDHQDISEKRYLLSCKDLCTIDHVSEMEKAGITSFKIEGRMKRPAYVYAVTKSYREVLDHQPRSFSDEELRQLFQRDFTDGYLFLEKQIVSDIYSGNRGLLAGKVMGYHKQKLSIQATRSIFQGDGIRIGFADQGKILNKIYVRQRLTNQVEAQEIFEIDFDKPIKKGTPIYKTTDFHLEKKIEQAKQKRYRAIPINMKLSGKEKQPLYLEMSDPNGFHVQVQSDFLLEKARQEMDTERIHRQLAKLGNTIYTLNQLTLQIEKGLFIPLTKLNELRRAACEKLDHIRATRTVRDHANIRPLNRLPVQNNQEQRTCYHFHNGEQFQAALPYLHNELCLIDQWSDYQSLINTYDNLAFVIPTIQDDQLWSLLDRWLIQYPHTKLAANNVGAYERYQKQIVFLLPGMNLSHRRAIHTYSCPAVISLDLSMQETQTLAHQENKFYTMVYGHQDVMTTRYCPISHVHFQKKIEHCQQCQNGQYALKDRYQSLFPLLCSSEQCITQVLSEKPLKRKKCAKSYIRFTLEDKKTVAQIIQEYQK